ncbi:MAG: ArsR family transcriptional regulator [Halobacteria archaeon]
MLLKTVASPTRVKILKLLLQEELHISALARRLGISVPVAGKHIRRLEKEGLIERRPVGRSHVLRPRLDRLYADLELLCDNRTVEVGPGSTLVEALQRSGVAVEKQGDREWMISVDGLPGYFVYEVDGKMPEVSIGRYRVERDVTIVVRRIVPVPVKRVRVRISREKSSKQA